MCCCCPSAINALFCLWFQSGCSKGSVAGALTFFPPDPPLYKFERLSASGQLLSDNNDNQDSSTTTATKENESNNNKTKKTKNDGKHPAEATTAAASSSTTATARALSSSHHDHDDDDLNLHYDEEELMEIVGPTGHVEPLEGATATGSDASSSSPSQKRSPAQQLTDRAKELRLRAKHRNAQDAADCQAGITYRLSLDPRIAPPSFATAGTVHAIKVPPASKGGAYIAALVYKCARPHCKTIIYSHGNATDIGAMFTLQAILVQSLECNVVVYDYSGYGASGGVAMEHATYKDIRAVYNYCCNEFADPSSIILYGQSVGSGPVCHLAYKNNDIGGIILHSPFTSGMRVLTPSRLLACLDIYPNINRIGFVRCPTMVIHGKLDEEVRFHHGLDMHNAIPEQYQREPWWVPDRGHNDITEGPGKMTEYIRRLRRFMASLNDEC